MTSDLCPKCGIQSAYRVQNSGGPWKYLCVKCLINFGDAELVAYSDSLDPFIRDLTKVHLSKSECRRILEELVEAIKREVWEEIRRVVEDMHKEFEYPVEANHCTCWPCTYDRLKTLIDSKLK